MNKNLLGFILLVSLISSASCNNISICSISQECISDVVTLLPYLAKLAEDIVNMDYIKFFVDLNKAIPFIFKCIDSCIHNSTIQIGNSNCHLPNSYNLNLYNKSLLVN